MMSNSKDIFYIGGYIILCIAAFFAGAFLI